LPLVIKGIAQPREKRKWGKRDKKKNKKQFDKIEKRAKKKKHRGKTFAPEIKKKRMVGGGWGGDPQKRKVMRKGNS